MSSKVPIGWFIALTLASIASRAHVRGPGSGRCSLDGVALEPVRRIDRMAAGAVRASFCSFGCALAWPEVPPQASWQVRDEISGRPIDATRALFVSGPAAAASPRGERLHVFESAADAAAFCARFGGERVENPFGRTPP